jgi:hypothetical protein
MAGAIQLESRGLLDAYTTDRPDFTFWKEGFHKKSQFSIQTVDIASSKDFEYGEIHAFKILPDHCDLLRGLSLKWTLPDIVLADSNLEDKDFVYGEACNFIEYITLSVGGVVIQHLTTEFLDLYYEIEHPTTKQVNLYDMCLRDVDTNPAVVNSRITKTRPFPRQLGGDVCLEIPFYFHNKPEMAFPVCALSAATEIDVEVKFRNVEECICMTNHGVTELEGFVGANEADLVTYKPYDLRLSTEVVFLDSIERIKVKNIEHQFAVPQIQYNDVFVAPQETEIKTRLVFSNLVQELYFFCMYTQNNAFGGTSNYNEIPVNSDLQQVDPALRFEHLEYLTLTLDGQEVIDEHTGSPLFLRLIQPRLHHRNTPITRRFYAYSFALYPNDTVASGHVNFSAVNDPILRVKLFSSRHPVGTSTTQFQFHERRFHILAKTLNFITIKGGLMTQVFDYLI